MKTQHIAVFTGALAPAPQDTALYWEEHPVDIVIAADSGFDTAMEYNKYFGGSAFLPSLLVGDQDSIKGKENIPKECKVEKCNTAKDLSDTEIALIRAREEDSGQGAGGTFVTLVGGDGGRFDHLLAIYDTFCTEHRADVWLLKEQKAIYLPDGATCVLHGLEKGDIVSAARLSEGRTGGTFKTEGLTWGGEAFQKEGMPSLSNWAAGGEAKITATGCAALVITSHKASERVQSKEATHKEKPYSKGDIEKQLDFAAEIDKMTHILRRTLLIDGTRRENDAEHSWHIAMMALIFAPYMEEKVNKEHAAALCLAHDLVEIYAGDTFAFDTAGYKTKEIREKQAADRLFSMLPDGQGEEVRALWEEFEAGSTAEAKLANCMDRLQPFLHNTLTDGHTWVEGKVKAADVFNRMKPVKECMPSLWPWVESKIKTACGKGFIT